MQRAVPSVVRVTVHICHTYSLPVLAVQRSIPAWSQHLQHLGFVPYTELRMCCKQSSMCVMCASAPCMAVHTPEQSMTCSQLAEVCDCATRVQAMAERYSRLRVEVQTVNDAGQRGCSYDDVARRVVRAESNAASAALAPLNRVTAAASRRNAGAMPAKRFSTS